MAVAQNKAHLLQLMPYACMWAAVDQGLGMGWLIGARCDAVGCLHRARCGSNRADLFVMVARVPLAVPKHLPRWQQRCRKRQAVPTRCAVLLLVPADRLTTDTNGEGA